MSEVLGPVSAVLEDDLRAAVSRGGLVVWLDADDNYSPFVDRLMARRAAGGLPYDLKAYRGSHLELMLALEAGKVNGRYTETELNGWQSSVAVYVGGETPIGVVYVGYGYSPNGLSNLYLFMGTP